MRSAPLILLLALPCALLYASLATSGDLRERLPLYFACHAVLAGLMLAAWTIAARSGEGASHGAVLAGALVFRLVMTAGGGVPALSDDVYRYVWDGRVQLHGLHPYRYAPVDPALAGLRDDDWSKINHPEVATIYPPGAEALFALLVACGAGPFGFKLALGLADFGVVLVLGSLLRRLRLPRDRLVLYAWNPLAVIETAGSAHVEPAGVLLLLLAACWIIDRRDSLSTLALAAAVHVKLLPALLLPSFARRWRATVLVLCLAALVLPLVAYGAAGPALGGGLAAYAVRWQHNAFLFAGLERAMEWLDTPGRLKPLIEWLQRSSGAGAPVPWEFFYRHVWPGDVARLWAALLAGAWAVWLASRADRDLPREMLPVLGAALLLSPTVHPWYLLWVLPFAAAYRSWGWLLLAATVPLAYCGGTGDVPWAVRWLEYAPPLAVIYWRYLGGEEPIVQA